MPESQLCTPCQESRHRMCEGGDCACPRRHVEGERELPAGMQSLLSELDRHRPGSTDALLRYVRSNPAGAGFAILDYLERQVEEQINMIPGE